MNLEQMMAEIRAGRVLSAKNESKLRAAIEALSEVISQLGMDETDSERAGAAGLERRFASIADIEIRAEGDKPATILGHAALFNTPSIFMGFREVIRPGAFADSLKGDIRALWQHDTTRVLGRTKANTLRLWEDDQGLAFELNPPDTQDGRDAVTLIERGDVDQMSFGFTTPPGGDSWSEDEDGIPLRELNKIGLMEVSPVTWAAYPQTGVGVMRSAPEWVQRALAHGVDDSSKADELARARLGLMLKRLQLFEKGFVS
jgi:HK97 family phage prohead protease